MAFVVAHRGLSAEAPENTFDSFDLAISNGIEHIEFDVQLTKDNEVVIIHDDTVDRTSNGAGYVSEKNLKELKNLDFGSWFSGKFKCIKIPTFEELLDRYKERAEAVKNRSIPPVGGDDRMAFVKQAEIDYQDFMIIADSEVEITEEYLILKFKLDN